MVMRFTTVKPSLFKGCTGMALALLPVVSSFSLPLINDNPAISEPVRLLWQTKHSFATDSSYIYKSATELAALIRERKANSVDIVRAFIAHIKKHNYKYNAIIWLREKEALEEAKQADAAVLRGDRLSALHGVPITVKEEFWVKGSPVTLNAVLFKNFVAPDDGPLVKQLKEAGAIIIGKTNLPTLLMDFQVQGEIYPTGSNPFDTSRTPGGSTGGGAAALAAGFTSLELGSDLGGSIRVPASFCGLYGLKTTFGTLNISTGDGPDTSSRKKRFALNTAGLLARTPEDLEAGWQILKDAPPDKRFQQPVSWDAPSGKKIADYHIAWTDNWQTPNRLIKVGTVVREKMHRLIDSLNKHSVVTRHYVPAGYDEMMNNYLTCLALLAGEGQSAETRILINKNMSIWDDGSGLLAPFYSTMQNPDDAAWAQWQWQNNKLKAQWDQFFKAYDFFICPITYGPAFKKCAKGSAIREGDDTISYFRYFPYAPILNPIECPAITVPLGLSDDGLPVAVQIIGNRYSEPELLYFARLLKPLVPSFIRPVLH